MAKKSLGQHWLSDQDALNKVITTADLAQHDAVLEIGPGRGDLTRLLLDKVDSVIAVEVDKDMIEQLVSTLPEGNLYLVHQDIREFDLFRMPKGYKVVANIPYYITSNIIRLLLEAENKPASITLLVQKEVAERITADAGSMSLLSVSVQFYAQAQLGDVVSAKLFNPVPKVDSQIVHLKTYDKNPYDVDTKKFFRLVKAGFSARRKKLKSSLAGGLRIDKEEVESAFR